MLAEKRMPVPLRLGKYYAYVISDPRKLAEPLKNDVIRQVKEITGRAFKREPTDQEIEKHTVDENISLLILIKEKWRGKYKTRGYFSTRPMKIEGDSVIYLAGSVRDPAFRGKKFYEIIKCLTTLLEGEKLRLLGEHPRYVAAQTQSEYVFEKLGDLGLFPAHRHQKDAAGALAVVSKKISRELDKEQGRPTAFIPNTCIRKGAYEEGKLNLEKTTYELKSTEHRRLFNSLDKDNGDAFLLSGYYRHPSLSDVFRPSKSIGEEGVLPHLYKSIKETYPNDFQKILKPEKLREHFSFLQDEIKPAREDLLKRTELTGYDQHIKTIKITPRRHGPMVFIEFKKDCFDFGKFRQELKKALKKQNALQTEVLYFQELAKELEEQQKKKAPQTALQSGKSSERTALPSQRAISEPTKEDTFAIGVPGHPETTHLSQIDSSSASITLDDAGRILLECIKKALSVKK